MNEEMEWICFQIISNSGGAKSSYIEAMHLAKAGNYRESAEKIEEAEQYFVEAHKIHTQLIQNEAAGEKTQFSLLFMHAEDQMASTEMAKLIAEEFIDLYKSRNEK